MSGISVVIPTYNRADLIRETLGRVLSQELAPDEIIVVDDGSHDETRSVLDSYGSQIRPLYGNNTGDLSARNRGLRAAAGQLVAFCDSDDLWELNFLAEMAKQWTREPKLNACYSDFRVLRNGILSERTKFDDAPVGYWTGMRNVANNAGVFDESIVARVVQFQPFFPSCTMVLRAPFLEAGGWDEGVSRIVGGDFATAIRIAAQPPLGVVQQSLVQIRKHGGNRSSNTEEMNLGDAQVLEHVLRTRPDLALHKDVFQRSAAVRRCEALDSAFARRDFAKVRSISRLLGAANTPTKQRVKSAISILPGPLREFAASLLSR